MAKLPTNSIVIEIEGKLKSISGWSREIGISAKSLNVYYHTYGIDKLKERIRKQITGELSTGRISNQKYKVGDKINGYEIKDDFIDEFGDRKFKLMCLTCGFEYQSAGISLLTKRNSCPFHRNLKRHNRMSIIEKRLKSVFRNMRNRCYKEASLNYDRYGAKGIKICEEWLNNPEEFIKWSLENGYKEGLTIDRIDSSKDYSPENCRWISREENSKRVCENTFLEVRGISDSYLGWCRRLNLSESTVKKWVRTLGRKGAIKRIEDVLDCKYKVRQPVKITVNGVTKNLTQWSLYFNLSRLFFFHIYERKGLEAVKSKIEELLSKQGD